MKRICFISLALALGWLAHSAAQTSGKKLLIAHRGASGYAPEHTLASYRLAIAQKADYVEQDLQITKDGVLVCAHDETLERTTNVEEVFPQRGKDEAGKRHWYVADFTLAEIKQLDAGSWFNEKFKGERVPTFQEAIDLVRGKAGLYPETKAPESTPGAVSRWKSCSSRFSKRTNSIMTAVRPSSFNRSVRRVCASCLMNTK